MNKLHRLVLASTFALLTASPVLAADDYITNAADIVKAADWSKVQVVTLEIDEFSYTPDKIVFKANQPYKLVLKNNGEKKHYFTAPEFYKAVASRKVETKDAEIKAPYFKELELSAAGGQLEFFFVPVTKGQYHVKCTIDDHEKQGMHGALTIE